MIMIYKKSIPRRTFLRGVGTAIALPLLDGMVPALAAAADMPKPVVRLAFVYGPNGRIMDQWTPAADGAAFEITPTLAPMAPFRDQMLVLSGLDVKAADARGNEGGGEFTHAPAPLTSRVFTPGRTKRWEFLWTSSLPRNSASTPSWARSSSPWNPPTSSVFRTAPIVIPT